jgi:LPXTG-motif cell wall-anchored protein
MPPPPELVVPGSTVERRLELAAAEPAVSEEDREPVAKSAVSSTGRPVGLTVLPHTGGVSLFNLALGGVMLGLGLLFRRIRR